MKRSSIVPLTKKVVRGVKVDGIDDQVIVTIEPDVGITVRTKRGRRKLVLGFGDLIDAAVFEDKRKRQPRSLTSREFLLGK